MTIDNTERWAVLGGGMLGMTLALRLAQAGKRVTLVEAAPSLGGLTSAWQLGGVTWDRYYHVTLLSDLHLRDLLRELDLEHQMQWRTTRTNFFSGKTLAPLNNVVDYLKLPGLRLLDKLRLGATIVFASKRSNGVPLERHYASDWLIRYSGRRAFEIIWKPLLRAKLGDNYKYASAAFIWSVIRRFYAARRGGMKTEMFGYVPGGYSCILAALSSQLKQAGVQILTSAPVDSIEQRESQYEIRAGEHKLYSDKLALCFAAPLAARIGVQLSAEEKERLQAIRYQGVVCASLLLARPLGGAYLTYITDDSLPFTTVIEMSSLVDRNDLGGHHLVYLPKYVPSDSSWFELSEAEIRRAFIDGLKKMFPDLQDSEVLAFRIARTRHVLAIPTLDYSSLKPPTETSVPGLFIVNSAQIVNASLNVNDTIKLANETAANLLQV